jgi:hypothetical protein
MLLDNSIKSKEPLRQQISKAYQAWINKGNKPYVAAHGESGEKSLRYGYNLLKKNTGNDVKN